MTDKPFNWLQALSNAFGPSGNEGEVRRGVPFLKDIPLLGMLFRSNSAVNSNRELVIFVTPRITNLTAVND